MKVKFALLKTIFNFLFIEYKIQKNQKAAVWSKVEYFSSR